jgi:hypothetical protein
MATDLAKLSLWLATLAREHEFSFLDHALKSGDSLVGLSRRQLSAGSWDSSAQRQTLLGQQIGDRVANVIHQRDAIRNAADDVALAIQEARHDVSERELARVRLIGDAIVAAFFKHDKPRQRIEEARYVATMVGGGSDWWTSLQARAVSLEDGDHPIRPFHWEIEFPEVFMRENGGFDAIVGNPPFAGKNTTIAGNRVHYLEWLQTLHEGAHGNADLVAHFFRRAFGLIRPGGAFGLIATNTIGQGDTRETGLCAIIMDGGSIAHAVKRLKWPGEAAVVVSVVHVKKGHAETPTLDGRPVSRVSAYLVEGDLDASPATLDENASKSFQGSILLGLGFTFDDVNAEKGKASTLAEMRRLIAKDPRNAEIIKPYLGGEEVNNSPTHAHHRYAIDFFDRPLKRMEDGQSWSRLSDDERKVQLRNGVVAFDYPDEVAYDWPDLIEIVERLVKPERDPQNRDALRQRWWQYAEKRPGLKRATEGVDPVIITARVSPGVNFTLADADRVYNEKTVVFADSNFGFFGLLQSRVHELWTRAFTSTLKDDVNYAPTDCFETFPLPSNYDTAPALETAGAAYHAHRAAMMIATNKGMTKTYNRFHTPIDQKADVMELRRLHGAMDDAVLRAYGWDDLAARVQSGDPAKGIPTGTEAPRFLTEEDEGDHTYQKRLFWPAPFRDELLARLLLLNEERAAAEREAS